MALDEPAKDDEVFDENGTKFVIDKDIFNHAKPIIVDFIETPQGSGFKVTSNLSAAGGGCGSSCSGC
jgi:Fe-S cluster assembly iron-binding protein IscA